jgi:MoxR-like ATPase
MVLSPWVVDQVLISLLNRGHILLESAPGLGKTTLVKALAKTLALESSRIQCTPDLMPSDITGSAVFNPKLHEFEFIPGPVFTQLLLVDEINRATPRTQSALLEAMAERTVSAERKTHVLDEQFLVLATQNPLEFAGTYPLPEAQLDRFFLKINLLYPRAEQLARIISANLNDSPLQQLKPVVNGKILQQLQQAVRRIQVTPQVLAYCTQLSDAVNKNSDVHVGISPRASIAWIQASQGLALLGGRTFVTPDDLITLAPSVLSHRMLLVNGDIADAAFLNRLFAGVAVPAVGAKVPPVKESSLSMA